MGSVLSSSPKVNGVEGNTMPPDLEMGQSTMEIDQSTIVNILLSMLPSAPPPAVGRALWGLGSFTLVLSLTTALHLPAAGPVFAHYRAAYYTILAFVLFIAVPVELATAFCLPRCSDGRRLLGFARGLLPCAYVLLLVVISVGMLFLEVSLVAFLLQGNEASGYLMMSLARNLNLLPLEL